MSSQPGTSDAIPDNLGTYIPAELAKRLADKWKVSREGLLIKLLGAASRYSRPKISSFPVGAVAMGLPKMGDDFGDVYLGASFEVKDEPLTVVVHGEQSALLNAWSHQEQGLQLLAISAPPCGYCRQFMWEATPHPVEMQVLLEKEGRIEKFALRDLLPNAFGPGALGRERAFLKTQDNPVTVLSDDPFVQSAIDGARVCYSPYTETFSAIALKTTSGHTAVGGYAENVAYNPSVSPMMSALNRLNLTSEPQAPMDIHRAVLVARKTDVSVVAESQAILKALGSEAELEVVMFEGSDE